MTTIQPREPRNLRLRPVPGNETPFRESIVDWEARRCGWEETRSHIEDLVPELVDMLSFGSLSRSRVSTRTLFSPRVWKLYVRWSGADAYDPAMRLAIRRNGDWALIGENTKGHPALVDPYSRFMPGVGQGYVLDEYRCVSNVVFGFTRNRIRRILLSQVS